MPLNVWTHFAMTVSGRVMTPYINGAPLTPLTTTMDLVLPTDQVYFNPSKGSPDTTTPTSVANVWFFPVALLPGQVNDMYNLTKGALS